MALWLLPFSYLLWHYTLALADLGRLGGNFLWFFYHWFSLPELSRTLFAPWRRLGESVPGGFHPQKWLAAKFINFLMRLIGFGCRLAIILTGVAALFMTALLLMVAYLVWLLLPLGLLGLILLGLRFLVF